MNAQAVPTAVDAERLDRIRAEQTRAMFRNCPLGVTSAAVVAAALSVALAATRRLDVGHAEAWSAMVIGCAAAHIGLCILYWRARPADREWRRWNRPFTLIAAVEGGAWFIGAIWMASSHDLTQELIVLLVFSAVASSGVPVFGPYLPTYLAFMVPTIAPHVVIALLSGYPFHGLLAFLEVTYLIAMPLIVRGFEAQFAEGLRLRFENLDLVEDLRRQKAFAEQANLAKSSFLAAASHDLRQPIHALSLFLGALRSRDMDDEARRLVDHIDGSVSAMDGLFMSLLDISKLDAGVVAPHFQPVAIGALLKRIARDHVDEAALKGVRLRTVDCAAAVWSDPILLERIVRNIVSNAVRYTDAGKVLIGCRRDRRAIRIEVWDTGRGIAAEQRTLIFQEFYQIGNPERDRTQGLGLGLAIVKRMSALIEATLTLASRPGRGSVFRLETSRCAPAPAVAIASEERVAGASKQGLILVIDDEPAIRDAMSRLLSTWGHEVVVAGSAVEMFDRLVGRQDRPDLIICDYRLRGGDNGIAVTKALLHRFGGDIPAMLITGDTAPDRIGEAQASGFTLLHKPLSNSKLRAAIGNLMRDV